MSDDGSRFNFEIVNMGEWYLPMLEITPEWHMFFVLKVYILSIHEPLEFSRLCVWREIEGRSPFDKKKFSNFFSSTTVQLLLGLCSV